MFLKKFIQILIVFPCLLQGQNIDSLKLALQNAKHDTTRCKILNILAETADDKEWPVFNEQLLKLSKKYVYGASTAELQNFYLKHYAGALNNAGVLAWQQSEFPKALEFYYKSLEIREKINDMAGIASTLNNIGAVYNGQGEFQKALEYYKKSLKIYGEMTDKNEVATTLSNIGLIYQNHGDLLKALEYYHKSLKLREKSNDKVGTATVLNNLGMAYERQGDIRKALDYHHKSLKINEEIMNRMGIGLSLNNIGLIYFSQGEFSKALEYYQKSLKIQEEVQYKMGIAFTLNNIGLIYYDRSEFEKALVYYHKSLKVQEEIMNKPGIALSLNNIGLVYVHQGDIPKALEFFNKSLKIKEEIMDKEGLALTLNNIGNTLLNQGKVAEAMVYAKRNMKTAEEIGYPRNIKDAASLFKSIYKKQNKFKEAFEMYALEIRMRDSINNEETQKAAVKKQMQYEYETQAKELKNEQDKKDIIAKAELKQREKERNYFVLGFVLVIGLALFIFRSYRQKQKANFIITQQKHEVEESRKEILDSIHYAKRIQKAHLPTHNYIEKNLNRLQNKG